MRERGREEDHRLDIGEKRRDRPERMYGMEIRFAGWYVLSGVNVKKVKDEERMLRRKEGKEESREGYGKVKNRNKAYVWHGY